MKGKILIPYARRGTTLVHISQVSSGLHKDCKCVACGESLVAKRPTKGIADHFAHEADADCKPESALHILGKELLAERIREALSTGGELALTWPCSRCDGSHSGNLLKRAASVQVEHDLGDRKPDLCLLDTKGEPCAVVEIVVSHEPDEGAREFYRRRKLPVVEFHLKGAEPLSVLQSGPLRPDSVSFCPVPAWQLRHVILGGTSLQLRELKIDLSGTRLSFEAIEEPDLGGHFLFDRPEQAATALARLKDGSLDGLNDPGWLVGICSPQDVNAAKIEWSRLGVHEFYWRFPGCRPRHWKRGRSAARF